MEEEDNMAKSVEAAFPKLGADEWIPLKEYYDLAGDMLKQAEIYRNRKNTLELYLILLRFHSLVTETIPSHQDYKLKHWNLRNDFKLKAMDAAMEIKSLKEDVECLIDEPKRIFEIIDLEKETCDFRIPSHFRILTPNHILPTINVDPSTTTTGTSDFYEKGNYGKVDEDGSSNTSEMYREVHLGRGASSTPPIGVLSLKDGSRSYNPDLKFKRTTSTKEDTRLNNHSPLQIFMDIASLKQALSKEFCERVKAEKYSLESDSNARNFKRLYKLEKRRRQKVEEVLLELTIELQNVKNKREEMKLQKEIFETKIADLKVKLAASENLIFCLQVERDDALRKAKEHSDEELFVINSAKAPALTRRMDVLEFSYFELYEATLNFDDSAKIMEGIYLSVYKGVLRHTTLAIKTMNPKFRLSQSEFLQEVDILNRLRHPNLVNLVGICSEHQSLIYEFLPNKSLGEHLNVIGGNCLYLSWQLLISIATDVCSALIFLHSCGLIHGNLKPSKILFDAHFTSKLSPTTKFGKNDPDFLSSGTPSRESDIYSFGIVILHLLTGRPVSGSIKEVNLALNNKNLSDILDGSAGEWPFVQARQLAYLGLRCCDPNPSNCPDLTSDVWKVLEPLRRASSPTSMLISPWVQADNAAPSYFMCPILQEQMMDPYIASDGFTYEGEAIRAWLNGGHDTSPMTNMRLPHQELIPNLALRSAIHEWLEQRGKGH